MREPTRLLTAFRAYLDACTNENVGHFLTGFDWSMVERAPTSGTLPVVSVLPALPLDGETSEARLLAELIATASVLQWGQTYGAGDFGEAFLARYGWTELFGTRGHFASNAMAGGFLLLGPDMLYPDHHHQAEEIYIPLTSGSLWSKDGGPFLPRDAGEIIHHPSDIRHAMQTRSDPLVALYLWRGGPLAQKSVIVANQRRRD